MSERKIVDYKFICGQPNEISQMVCDFLSNGYVPYYGHTVCHGIIGQSMVKYED